MGKSTRSKVKRSWRAKKREEGVYAATEAARLHRLHQKLKVITKTDAEGDLEVEDEASNVEELLKTQDGMGGRYCLSFLGLIDHERITSEGMEKLISAKRGASHASQAVKAQVLRSEEDFDHLFSQSLELNSSTLHGG